MVAEYKWSGTGSALASIDRDEVRALVPGGHALGKFVPERLLANRRLDAHRQACGIGDRLDKIDEAVDVMKRRVPVRAEDGLADLHAPCLSDGRRNLFAG